MNKPIDASFRDKSGFIFEDDGLFYRQINHSYRAEYEKLKISGLYEKLIEKKWLIPHEEIPYQTEQEPQSCYKIIKPEQLDFISYPYGWSFSMLKDAALLTLKIQKTAIKYGMTLKDASAYNIQFRGSQPIFIDTLSFETYTEGAIWEAYSQFCRHFLAPLALMSYQDISLNRLLSLHLDGIPLPLTAKLLPFSTRLNINLYLHIHLQARLQTQLQQQKEKNTEKTLSQKALLQLIDSLESTIKKLSCLNQKTEWHDYYEKSVATAYFDKKTEALDILLDLCKPQKVLDLGANDGSFSRLAAQKAQKLLSFDIDPACVEANYLRLKKEKNENITPYLVDISNPEPAIGWANKERPSVWQRTKVDTIMALAIIHHLCISNNTPLSILADFLSQHCQNLIIEFVPKTDEKVQRLLQNRKDIFDYYTMDNFKSVFEQYFTIEKQLLLEPTERTLFLMKNKQI